MTTRTDAVACAAQSAAGRQFRVDPATGDAREVDLGGATLGYPGGLELVGRT